MEVSCSDEDVPLCTLSKRRRVITPSDDEPLVLPPRRKKSRMSTAVLHSDDEGIKEEECSVESLPDLMARGNHRLKEKRAAARSALLDAVPQLIRKVKERHVKVCFEIIDRTYFGGRLKHTLADERRKLTFGLSGRMTSRAGQLSTLLEKPRQHCLSVSEPLIQAAFGRASARTVRVNGLVCQDRVDVLLRIVEHESVHLLLRLNVMSCETPDSHDAFFQQCVRKLFGHTDWRHDLVTGQEVAHKSGISIGAPVRFKFKGEVLIGQVNRVTKNATVLCPCNSKHPDAREFHNAKFYRKFIMPLNELTAIHE